MILGQLTIHTQKNEFGPITRAINKTNPMSKWIEDLYIGTKTTKPTETACRTKGEETEKEKLE